jgi:hypothetical protein
LVLNLYRKATHKAPAGMHLDGIGLAQNDGKPWRKASRSVEDVQAHLRHAKADTTANEYGQELPVRADGRIDV